MGVSVREAAEVLGVSARQARRHASSGRISNSQLGSQYIVSSRHLIALQRCAHHGRPWSEVTRLAALDLLSSNDTERLVGSERSRLKQRLRRASIATLAGQLLQGGVTLRTSTGRPEALATVQMAELLGLTTVGSLEVLVSEDPVATARIHHLALDDAGKIAVVAGREEHREVLTAVTLYAYGDTRESAAAAQWIRTQQERI